MEKSGNGQPAQAARPGRGRPEATKSAAAGKISDLTLDDALKRAGSETARQVLVETARFAGPRRGGDEAIAGASAMTRAVVLVGLDASRTAQSAPRWLSDWLHRHADAERIRAWVGHSAPPEHSLANVFLSNNAVAALDRAADFTQRTVGRTHFDARHLVAGLLVSPPRLRRAVSWSFLRTVGVDLVDFLPELFDRVTNPELREPSENVEAWREILLGGESSVRFLPGYAADRPDGTMPDTLGIAAEVRAFAELICLRAARPPLSIGLFGEWGSGKTFFMEKLQHTIGDICAAARSGAGEAHFVENVVQIRFNAWHYNDANLWACLTAEVFEQLRAGGHEGMPGAAYDRLVGEVVQDVRQLESEIADDEKIAVRLAAEIREKETEVAQARDALEGVTAERAPLVGDAVKETFANESHALEQIGPRLYGEELSNDMQAFAAISQEAVSYGGQVRLIASALLLRWPAILMIAAAVLTTSFIALSELFGEHEWVAFATRFLTLGGGLLSAAAAFWQAYEAVGPILKGANAVRKDRREEQARLARTLREKQDDLDRTLEREKTFRGQAERRRDRLTTFADEGPAPSQAALLRYFLFEDSETQDFSRHVGLISRARRAFETLDIILRRAREARAAGGKSGHDRGPNAPDRIILYIDDLDRCSHAQVYDVLQAVHLLLAFESFVVVVGVDVRWVELALARHMGVHGLRNGEGSLHDEAGRLSRSRSVDYLEKIFQIPFWLKPLDADATYRAYVAGLLGGTDGEDTQQAAPADEAVPVTTSAADEEIDPDIPDDDDQGAPETPREETFSPVILKEAEVAFLTSPAIGRVAGTSPRAVRRFVNLYRLVRAQRRGEALDRFIGETGGRAEFPLVAFLLALESGQPDGVVHAFHRVVEALDDGEIIGPAVQSLENSVENVAGAGRVRQTLGDALEEVETLRGARVLAGEVGALSRESRRYTFHRLD